MPVAGEEIEPMSDKGTPLLIRRARVYSGQRVDLRLRDGLIADLGDCLDPLPGEFWIDARDGLLLPGLQDHHLHLFAAAAARESLVCGPPEVSDEAQLRSALVQRVGHLDAKTGGQEPWIRGVAFHESVCEQLDRHWLDAVCPHLPVRIQHRSGMMWVLNSRALECLAIQSADTLPVGAERDGGGALTGRFFDLDDWLGARFTRTWPSLRSLSAELARYGITGVTDTGARNGLASWQALAAACERGELRQRLLVMGTEELNGQLSACGGRVAVGPVKIYLRDSDLPALEELVKRMASAHRHGRAVAMHCVTRVELLFALSALQSAGAIPGDRIEHAAIADDAMLEALASLGVTVVTQPHFIAERGDQYLEAVDAWDIPYLYRGAAFLHHKVALAAGSDAPYGGTDPWASMAAAVKRDTRRGVTMALAERLTPEQALALYGGEPLKPGGGLRTLAPGQPADLCLLAVGWEQLREDLDARHVRLTLCDGDILYQAPDIAFGQGA